MIMIINNKKKKKKNLVNNRNAAENRQSMEPWPHFVVQGRYWENRIQ